jgi:Transposase DDE domain group 1
MLRWLRNSVFPVKMLLERGFVVHGTSRGREMSNLSRLGVRLFCCANQVRLVLHTAAFWLIHDVRAVLPQTSPLANAEFATIRERLIKIGARVIEHIARIRVHRNGVPNSSTRDAQIRPMSRGALGPKRAADRGRSTPTRCIASSITPTRPIGPQVRARSTHRKNGHAMHDLRLIGRAAEPGAAGDHGAQDALHRPWAVRLRRHGGGPIVALVDRSVQTPRS